jgi:hypothetical protein
MATKNLITSKSLIHISIIPTLIILFIIYYFYTYYYNDNKNKNVTEEFTPKIREMYRPYLRDVRIVSEGFYGDGENNINRLFRKFGLY